NGLCSSEAGMRGIYLPSTSPANRRTQATPEYAHRWSLVGKVLKGELVSGTTMKELDRRAIEEKGVPSLVLMERAAQAVVEALRAGVPALSAGNTPSTSKNLLCVCGAGNNGGDGFAVARLLSRAGIPAEALFVGDERKMTAETRQQALLARDCGVAIHDNDLSVIAGSGILVDALFGIGLMRALAGAYLEAVRALCKARAAGAYVLAVDIPSGISPDTGEALGAAVAADETVTFAYPKIGQTIGQGLACSGKLSVADIGVYQD
ncbi:MAG: NAD(P)H-hydrate epimerase, partial [Coriobacteriaceae bacterium]|nr:NAD(P)H-hydrate epimerase [Coriobacteriaceae bacterium]